MSTSELTTVESMAFTRWKRWPTPTQTAGGFQLQRFLLLYEPLIWRCLLATPNNPNPSLSDHLDASDTGTVYNPTAHALITYTKDNWSSEGSTANLNPTKMKADEQAKAYAKIRDPWHFDPIPVDDLVTFAFTLMAGTYVQAATDGPDSWGTASFSSDFSVSGLGDMWTLSWGIDSSKPGVPNVSFVSNPILGLNDTLIRSNFLGLLNGDAASGSSTLQNTFSFSYQFLIPANTTPQFSEQMAIDVAGGTTVIPEPSPLSFLSIGGTLIGASVLSRVRSRKRHTSDVQRA
jgi:hypothetical protein